MWSVNGYYAFLAEESGATKVTAVDIAPPTPEFETTYKSRNSKINFIQGNIFSEETAQKTGKHDVVYFSDVLLNCLDLVNTLTFLHKYTADILIIVTNIIPEHSSLKNLCIFYPYLDEKNRKLWSPIDGKAIGLTTPYEPNRPYNNWIWGISPSALESILKTSGYKIIQHYYFYLNSLIICTNK